MGGGGGRSRNSRDIVPGRVRAVGEGYSSFALPDRILCEMNVWDTLRICVQIWFCIEHNTLTLWHRRFVEAPRATGGALVQALCGGLHYTRYESARAIAIWICAPVFFEQASERVCGGWGRVSRTQSATAFALVAIALVIRGRVDFGVHVFVVNCVPAANNEHRNVSTL